MTSSQQIEIPTIFQDFLLNAFFHVLANWDSNLSGRRVQPSSPTAPPAETHLGGGGPSPPVPSAPLLGPPPQWAIGSKALLQADPTPHPVEGFGLNTVFAPRCQVFASSGWGMRAVKFSYGKSLQKEYCEIMFPF